MNAAIFVACFQLLTVVGGAAPSNDECETATAISGEGEFSFVNVDATDTNPTDECSYEPGVEDVYFHADLWYCWTAGSNGPVTVDTCGSTAADTVVGIYEGCGCPAEAMLECNHNGCASQSVVEFQALAGQEYLIRIGSSPGFGFGSDTFHISERAYDHDTICYPPWYPATYSAICQSRSGWDAFNSTRGEFQMIDDFVPSEGGVIRTICWAGVYLRDGAECIRHVPDSFQVTYYHDSCGAPGAVLAGPFTESHSTLDLVYGPTITSLELPNGAQEFEFSATHWDVPVAAGQTYWVGITNSSAEECRWYWETSQKVVGSAIQIDQSSDSMSEVKSDLAFCFDVHHETRPACLDWGPANDNCSAAEPLLLGTTEFDTRHATTDGPFHYYNYCHMPLGETGMHKDIWFSLVNACPGNLSLSLCESEFDTKLGVYRDSQGCVIFEWQNFSHCSDDACGTEGLQSDLSFSVTDESEYLIRIGGYDGANGAGTIVAHYVPPAFSSLREFAALANCFAVSVESALSNPPSCCIATDYDGDADVDLFDARLLIWAIAGPQ